MDSGAGATTDRRRTAALVLLGAALVALAVALHRLGSLQLDNRSAVALMAGLLVVCGLAALLLWRRARRRDVVLVIAVAIVARAVLAFDMPSLSDDAYRFVWDGRVQAHGINPYRYVPVDARLRPLRDFEVFTHVNHPYTRTIYPPALELTFAGVHAAAGDRVVAMKLAFLAVEGVALVLLLLVLARASLSPGRVVLYAWHPLAIVETASSGHPEALLLAFTLAAVLLWDSHRRLGAGAALGAAALTKFTPLLLAPFMFRRLRWRFAAALGTTIGLLYAPYLGAGSAVLGSVGQYSGFTFGSGPFRWLAQLGVPDGIARAVLLAGLAALVVITAWRPPRDLVAACGDTALLFAGAILASSNVQPWYLLWLLPFLCVRPVAGLLWAAGTAPLYYLALQPDVALGQTPLSIVVWGPTVVLLAAEAARPSAWRPALAVTDP